MDIQIGMLALPYTGGSWLGSVSQKGMRTAHAGLLEPEVRALADFAALLDGNPVRRQPAANVDESKFWHGGEWMLSASTAPAGCSRQGERQSPLLKPGGPRSTVYSFRTFDGPGAKSGCELALPPWHMFAGRQASIQVFTETNSSLQADTVETFG